MTAAETTELRKKVALSCEPVWRYYVQLLDHQRILSQELVPNV